MQTGVYPLNNAWMWRCAKCDTAAKAPIPQRVEARAAYKAHRASCRSGTPAVVPADPPKDSTSPAPPTTETKDQETPAEPQLPKEDVVATKKTPAAKAKVTKKKATTKAKTTKKKVATAAKKKAGAKRITTGAGGVFRFAFVKGKKGQTVARAVNESGEFSSRVAERLGVKRASKWGRIKAASKDAAIAALKAEKGQWFTKSKGESA